MGKVISPSASTERILTDVGRTLKRAITRGSPYREAAESFLGSVHAESERIDERVAEAEEAWEVLRAEQAYMDDLHNTWVHNLKDRLWHLIGRASSDPILRRIFPGGSSRYTEVRPSHKPDALQLLATMLETNRHPMIADEVVQESAAELREAATAMAELNARLATARTAFRIVGAQRTSNAKQARMQLMRLKRHWKAQGVSEVDIHQVIPDRPRASRSDPAEEAQAALEEALEVDAISLAAK